MKLFHSILLKSQLLVLCLHYVSRVHCNLNICTGDKNVTYYAEPEKCYSTQSDLAKQRHIVKLVKRDQYTSLELVCHVCPDENLTQFQWFRITRNVDKTIFVLNEKTTYSSKWILDENLLEPIKSDLQTNDPCIINSTNELVFNKFNPFVDSGTYVCRSLNESDHPLNFIWYHVDYINSYEDVSHKVEIPIIRRMDKSATTYHQLEQLQNKVEKEINLSEDFHDQKFNLLQITSKSFHNLTHDEDCGPIKVRQNRVCYIHIPRKVPDHVNIYTDEIQLLYFVLLNAFSEFGQFYDDQEQKGIWPFLEISAKNLAVELGFMLFMSEYDLYIPCQYNFFKQLPNLKDTFQPLKIFNLHISVTYDLSCGESNAIELVNLALQRDLSKIKLNILGYNDVRFMQLEKLSIEHEPFLKLDCRTVEKVICDGSYYPIIWRTKNHTFYRRTLLHERIYIDDACDLILLNVRLNDSDVYSCYTRDTRQLSKWHPQPKLSYRLKIEKSHYQWPNKNDILIGLIFLILWSIFIVIIWFILMIYNLHITYESKVMAYERLRNIERLERFKNERLQNYCSV
ncbi:unnamed protein product [Heterobilharzia americana]|nr:unnamed protein product [Heterobilharzia americana]CAH8436943.1 unnamed protein product [Heterobilharzia americana]